MKKFESLKQELNELVQNGRNKTVLDWEVIDTIHGAERLQQRSEFTPEQHMDMLEKIQKKAKALTRPGEFMFTSKSKNRSYVMNIDPKNKQMRVITVLPLGRHNPKPGTQKIMTEWAQLIEIFVE